MNKNIFDIKRFGTYFSADFTEAVKRYGINTIFIACSMVFAWVMSGLLSVIFTGEWCGLSIVPRAIGFVAITVAASTSAPVKIYGKVTNLHDGTFFLLTPASPLEKSASMILISCVIFPLTIIISALGVDALMCAIDHNCGASLLSKAVSIKDAYAEEFTTFRANGMDIAKLANPLIFIDDMIQVGLLFLLGSCVFKKNKFVLTSLAIIGISFVIQTIASSIIMIFLAKTGSAGMMEILENLSPSILNHAALIDTISDTVMNLILATCVFFRIKTLKH